MNKYTHKEAFCLMWYACECGHRERIWNSRDGVTPFAMGCPSCGEASLRHVRFDQDKPLPDHKPHDGQGIWRDGTADDAERFMTARLDKCVGTPYEVNAALRAEIIESVRQSKEPGEFGPGWPMFERVVQP